MFTHWHRGSSSTVLDCMEFGKFCLWGDRKTGVPREKLLGARKKTINKLNPRMTSLLRFESWPKVSETNLTPASYFHKQQSVDFVTAYSSLFIYPFLKNQGHYLSYNKARNLAKLFEEHNNIIFEHIWSYIALQIPVSTPVCRWLHATAIKPFSLSQEYFSYRTALQMAIIYYWRMKSCWCHILQSKFSSNIHSLHYRPHLAGHLWRLHFLYLSLGLFSLQNWSPTADSSSSRTQTAIIVSTPVRKGTLTQNVEIASISVYKPVSCWIR